MISREKYSASLALRIPAEVFDPVDGEDVRVWSERWLQFFRERDFARGVTVYAPDGGVFFKPVSPEARAIIPVFDRAHAVREWERVHPGR